MAYSCIKNMPVYMTENIREEGRFMEGIPSKHIIYFNKNALIRPGNVQNEYMMPIKRSNIFCLKDLPSPCPRAAEEVQG